MDNKQNLPATQSQIKNPAKVAAKLEVDEAVVTMLTPQQLGWLQLAKNKRDVFASLEADELKVQELVTACIVSDKLDVVQKQMKEIKDLVATSKEKRLVFTNDIKAKLIDTAMEYEERNAELLNKVTTHEFALRKKANEAQQATAAKQKEEAAFEAHVKNEHIRIGSAYRLELAQMVTDAYINALNPKATLKPSEIPEYLEKIKVMMQEIKLLKFNVYPRTIEKYIDEPLIKNGKQIADQTPVYKYIDDKRAAEIFKSVPAYNAHDDLKDALEDLDKKFEMYDLDFKNAKAAIKAAAKKLEEQQATISETAEQEVATNNLMKSVGNYSVNTTKGKTEVKRKYVLEVANDEQWALSVLSAFLKNWSAAKQLLKVKTWDKLSLAQMGKALAELKTSDNELEFANLKFTVDEK